MSLASMAHGEAVWPRLKAKRRVLFWAGCFMALLGAAAMAAPEFGQFVIGAFAGWLLWLAGAIMLAACLLIGSKPLIAGVASSLVAIAAGIFLLFNPQTGALAVAILAAAVFMVDGAFQIALALNLRPLKVWRWVLSSAAASALAAILITAGASGSLPAFGAIAGFAVLSTGLALIGLSESAKKA